MEIILKTPIIKDKYTEIAESCFDFTVPDILETKINYPDSIPDNYNVGLIVGGSGTGKSSILKKMGTAPPISFDARSLISNLDTISPEDASRLLCSCGLSSIPDWIKPYNCLSNGQQFRAQIAKVLSQEKDLYIFDEFTSVVDREIAKSLSFSVQKYIRSSNKKAVFASCHYDIIDWLMPDWIFDLNNNKFEILTSVGRRRPKMEISFHRTTYHSWQMFKNHHYLSYDINRSCRCFVGIYNNTPVVFTGIISMPHADLKNAWRESRTVVIPEFQGLGIGVKTSDFFGSIISSRGLFYSRTSHPSMIAYRKKSELWEHRKENVSRKFSQSSKMNESSKNASILKLKPCVSFKYIGPKNFLDAELFYG